MVEGLARLKWCDPRHEDTEVGPLATGKIPGNRLTPVDASCRKAPAAHHTGGKRLDGPGTSTVRPLADTAGAPAFGRRYSVGGFAVKRSAPPPRIWTSNRTLPTTQTLRLGSSPPLSGPTASRNVDAASTRWRGALHQCDGGLGPGACSSAASGRAFRLWGARSWDPQESAKFVNVKDGFPSTSRPADGASGGERYE